MDIVDPTTESQWPFLVSIAFAQLLRPLWAFLSGLALKVVEERESVFKKHACIKWEGLIDIAVDIAGNCQQTDQQK